MFGPKINLFNDGWIDTVFEGRNQQYGAYELRKTSGKYSIRALLIGGFIFSFGLAAPVILEKFKSEPEEVEIPVLDTKTVLANIEPIKKIEEIEKPVVAKQTKTIVEVVKHVPPVIVEKQTVDTEIKSVDDFKNKVTGSANIEASDDGDLVLDKSHSTVTVESEIVDNSNMVYQAVEVMPGYPGGMAEFYNFVKKNYSTEGITRDVNGNVIVQFIVEKDGSLTDIKVVRDLGFNTGPEAVRVLKKAKKWNPGIQNGVPVRVKYTLPIRVTVKA